MFSDLTFKGRYRYFTLRPEDVYDLGIYLGVWLVIFYTFPNSLHDSRTHIGALIIGAFGVWRYSWWMWNLGRSQYYGHVQYPAMRAQADNLWYRGLRPRHVHFLMTTFHEDPWTTCKCLEGIINEIRDLGLSATLWVGTGTDEDELIIKRWLETSLSINLKVVLLRQNQPGKRVAIGIILRALSRHQVHRDDIAVLLDGDTIITQGCMQKCLSLFGAQPTLQALTTDEDALCIGPAWIQEWLTMRFAQRRLWMQSHALSRRVLTLTGRFSVFRAQNVVEPDFIRLVEADHLDHWFWGSFRFLSGDDKSTWFYLLGKRADMIYVPDAIVFTVERVEGNGLKRARDNVLRWSGNMLRNGMRAIMLGPRVVPPFIWWCLVDQRLVIVTTLTGFFTAMFVIFFIRPEFFFTYLLWIMMTRLLMSSAMFCYSTRIHISYPAILYCNQLLLAFVKAYLIFRLPQQRWANRQDQRDEKLIRQKKNRIFPLYQNVFYTVVLMLAILIFTGTLTLPDVRQLLPLSRNFWN